MPLTARAPRIAPPSSLPLRGRSDGLMDLLVRIANTPTAKNHVYRNTGGGVFADLTAAGNQVYSAAAAGSGIWCDVSTAGSLVPLSLLRS